MTNMVRINPKPFGNKVKYELKYIVPKIVRVFLLIKLQIALSKVKCCMYMDLHLDVLAMQTLVRKCGF